MIYSMGKPAAPSLKIETHVPIPKVCDSFNRKDPLYLLAPRMEVGNSVAVPYTRQPLAANMGRATGFKFTARKEGDFLRIWRIE
jgi:hypothetical protein